MCIVINYVGLNKKRRGLFCVMKESNALNEVIFHFNRINKNLFDCLTGIASNYVVKSANMSILV